MPTVYRIQRSDGLYSTGGNIPEWKKEGKTWASIANVRSHLRIVGQLAYPSKCKLLTLEVTEVEVPGPSLAQLQEEAQETAQQETARRQLEAQAAQEKAERASLALLKRKYEGG